MKRSSGLGDNMADDEERMRPRSGGSRVVGEPSKANPAVAPKPERESESKPPKKKKTGEGDE